jgi:hypothetical protein
MKGCFIATVTLIVSLVSIAGAQEIPAEYQQVLTTLGRQGDWVSRCSCFVPLVHRSSQ